MNQAPPKRIKVFYNTARASSERSKKYVKPLRNRYFRRLSKDERFLAFVMGEMYFIRARIAQIPIEIKKVHAGLPLKKWSAEIRNKVSELKTEQRKLRSRYDIHRRDYKEHIEACRGGAKLGTYGNNYTPHQIAKHLSCDVSIIYRVWKQYIKTGCTDFASDTWKPKAKSMLRASEDVLRAQMSCTNSCPSANGTFQKVQEDSREPAEGFPYLQAASLSLGEISKFLKVKIHNHRFTKDSLLGDIIDFGSEYPDYDYSAKTVEWMCDMLKVREYLKLKIKPARLGWTLKRLAWVINNTELKKQEAQEKLLRSKPKESQIIDIYERTGINDERYCYANVYRSLNSYFSDYSICQDYLRGQEWEHLDLDESGKIYSNKTKEGSNENYSNFLVRWNERVNLSREDNLVYVE